MLPVDQSAWRLRLLRLYLRSRLRTCFHSVRLELAEPWRQPVGPVVFFGNHHSWWDGLLEVILFQHLGLDFRVMMEEKHLRRFPFFRRTGAFGVEVETAGGRQAGLLYAARFLRAQRTGGAALLLFPEGRLHHAPEGIHPFSPGLEGLARLVPGATFLPLAKWIQQYRHPRPEAILRIGLPVAGPARTTEGFGRALAGTWQEAGRQIVEPPGPATIWLRTPAPHRGETG